MQSGDRRPSADGPVAKCHRRLTGRAGVLRLSSLALQRADAFGDPGLGRGALQIVIEPGADAAVVVVLILLLPQAVILTVVDQHHDVLLRSARDVVELDRLVPEHRTVAVPGL